LPPANGATTRVGYDVGNEISVTDPLGNQTHFTYDARNRLVQETDPLNSSATWVYDSAGPLVSTTDRDGRQDKFATIMPTGSSERPGWPTTLARWLSWPTPTMSL
jgi:YD repeat-containing protein